MQRTTAAFYLGATSVVLNLHLTAPIALALVIGALIADATHGDDP